MGGLAGMLGLNGGAAGSGFAPPVTTTGAPVVGTPINGTNISGADLTPGVNANQLNQGYSGGQNSLQSQQALLQALQGQNGIGNQSQVYNQLQGVANGTGPNPAQAMLANQTRQNIANQAALMAGQRGAGANVGLMARQAGQQGAGIQQNAIGQGAALQAQQQLNALGAAGNMANQQANNQIGATTANAQANLTQEQLLQNALAQQNAQNVAMQSNLNNANVGMQSNINNANVGMQSNINNANANLAGAQMHGQQGIVGGLMNGLGALGNFLGGGGGGGGGGSGGGTGDIGVSGPPTTTTGGDSWGSGGGDSGVPGAIARVAYAEGGMSGEFDPTQSINQSDPAAPKSSFGKFLQGWSTASQAMAQGGNVGSSLQKGGHVPGRAPVKGNSYANDKVKALLSPGELVVDRETMADGGKAGQAARFLAAVIAAKKKGGK